MRRYQIAVVMFIMTLLGVSNIKSAKASSVDMKSLVKGNTGFALDLYSVLKKEEGNLFFSPYSISAALAMTYGGARGNTEKQMKEVLHLTLGWKKTHSAFAEFDTKLNEVQKKGKVQLHIANSLWPRKDYRLLPEYISLIKKYYGVSVTSLDYVNAAEKACKIINKWVEDKTKEKIKDLIRKDDLDPKTILILVNAIYFKGNWASQFYLGLTMDSDFTLSSGQKKRVPMMYQRGKFGYKELETAQLLELPYAGKDMSMIIMLPKGANALSEFENRLSVENFDSWLSYIPQKKVKVFLPKFKIMWGTFKLNKPLKALGMRDAFSSRADFSGMDGTKNLFLGLVLHKAFVEVNEEGTEAAAAAVGRPMIGMDISKVHAFRADHPFVFLIRDNTTGSILFLGRVVDPSKEKY